MPEDSPLVTLSRAELEGIIQRAMVEGARQVRLALGVPTDEAAAQEFVRGLHEAKELVDAWNDTKNTLRRSFVKWLVGAFFAVMAGVAGVSVYDKLK